MVALTTRGPVFLGGTRPLLPCRLELREESLMSEATVVMSERRSSLEPILLDSRLARLRLDPELPLLGGGSLVIFSGAGLFRVVLNIVGAVVPTGAAGLLGSTP